MIYEEIKIEFSLEDIRQELSKIIPDYPPVMLNQKFGGWSITSSNGSYQDGWIRGDGFSNDNTVANFDLATILQKNNFKGTTQYRTPTEICGQETKKLIAQLEVLGLFPCRARFMLLKAGGESNYHRDCPENLYAVRLHIPIITNEKCLFICEDGQDHLLASKAYLLRVNRLHKVVNHGESDRIHFVCDVYDTKAVSQYHHFTKEHLQAFEKTKSNAP